MKKRGWLRRKLDELNKSVTLSRLMIIMILAILINAGLMTSSSYLLMLRTGIMRPLMNSTMWPLLLVLLCLCFAFLLAACFVGQKLSPLHKVNDAMKQVSHGDFSVRIPRDNSSNNRWASDVQWCGSTGRNTWAKTRSASPASPA